MNEPMEWSAKAERRFELQPYEPRPTIDGVELVELTRHADDGGSMTELLRLDGSIPQSLRDLSIRQINYYSEIEPGVIRAFHLHGRQTAAWSVPPSDPLPVVPLDVRTGPRPEAA